jgi:hypothetical protein
MRIPRLRLTIRRLMLLTLAAAVATWIFRESGRVPASHRRAGDPLASPGSGPT